MSDDGGFGFGSGMDVGGLGGDGGGDDGGDGDDGGPSPVSEPTAPTTFVYGHYDPNAISTFAAGPVGIATQLVSAVSLKGLPAYNAPLWATINFPAYPDVQLAAQHYAAVANNSNNPTSAVDSALSQMQAAVNNAIGQINAGISAAQSTEATQAAADQAAADAAAAAAAAAAQQTAAAQQAADDAAAAAAAAAAVAAAAFAAQLAAQMTTPDDPDQTVDAQQPAPQETPPAPNPQPFDLEEPQQVVSVVNVPDPVAVTLQAPDPIAQVVNTEIPSVATPVMGITQVAPTDILGVLSHAISAVVDTIAAIAAPNPLSTVTSAIGAVNQTQQAISATGLGIGVTGVSSTGPGESSTTNGAPDGGPGAPGTGDGSAGNSGSGAPSGYSGGSNSDAGASGSGTSGGGGGPTVAINSAGNGSGDQNGIYPGDVDPDLYGDVPITDLTNLDNIPQQNQGQPAGNTSATGAGNTTPVVTTVPQSASSGTTLFIALVLAWIGLRERII